MWGLSLSNHAPAPMNTKSLRHVVRTRRRQLSNQTHKAHSLQMKRLASAYTAFRHSHRIAFYFAADGEMDPAPLVKHARHSGKRCFFPVLRNRPSRSLWFAEHKIEGRLKNNRFGIPEPASHHKHISMPWGLDLIFVPLVAFDTQGNRLGMGGGFYDRTLAFRKNRHHWPGPRLVGLAHECQRVDDLQAKPWDIQLDAIITEKKIYSL